MNLANIKPDGLSKSQLKKDIYDLLDKHYEPLFQDYIAKRNDYKKIITQGFIQYFRDLKWDIVSDRTQIIAHADDKNVITLSENTNIIYNVDFNLSNVKQSFTLELKDRFKEVQSWRKDRSGIFRRSDGTPTVALQPYVDDLEEIKDVVTINRKYNSNYKFRISAYKSDQDQKILVEAETMKEIIDTLSKLI